MAKKKLTLSVDEAVIESARRFADRNSTSISRLVTEFLGGLGEPERSATPVTDRLTGLVMADAALEEYRRHLDRKYL
ncbi:MAG: DUF6364 family protein [Gemmatimonadota bacterium]|nr:DUF6364 family protein [Gemmatimonadota bacterium]